jgi:hypothetical protein
MSLHPSRTRKPPFGETLSAGLQQRNLVSWANSLRQLKDCRSRLLKWRCAGVAHAIGRSNDHPSGILCLALGAQNFAETIKIKIGNLVVSLPFHIDAYNFVCVAVVNAHDERCILDVFHILPIRLLRFALLWKCAMRRISYNYHIRFIRGDANIKN